MAEFIGLAIGNILFCFFMLGTVVLIGWSIFKNDKRNP